MNKKISLDSRVFIAGANGMVGRATFRKLQELGYGKKENNGIILTPSRKELDLTDFNKVESWFSNNKPNVVILAAAKVGGIEANRSQPADFILNNLKIQANVIELSYKYKVKRLLFLGSSCIYPKFAKQPLKEEYLLSGDLEQTNQMYSIAKIAGLKICESLKLQYDFDAISLMPTNLYGPFDNYTDGQSHVLPALLKRFVNAVKNNEKVVSCWGDGSPLREFLYVDDLASAIVFALENWFPNKNIQNSSNKNIFYLNVGSGEEISIRNLAEKISVLTNFKGDIEWDPEKPNGNPRKMLDSSRIFNMGWSPKTSLDEGIKKTYHHYLNSLAC